MDDPLQPRSGKGIRRRYLYMGVSGGISASGLRLSNPSESTALNSSLNEPAICAIQVQLVPATRPPVPACTVLMRARCTMSPHPFQCKGRTNSLAHQFRPQTCKKGLGRQSQQGLHKSCLDKGVGVPWEDGVRALGHPVLGGWQSMSRTGYSFDVRPRLRASGIQYSARYRQPGLGYLACRSCLLTPCRPQGLLARPRYLVPSVSSTLHSTLRR